jgi:hypothetical protein
MCHKHYMRWYNAGKPEGVAPKVIKSREGNCKVFGCKSRISYNELCNKHAKRMASYGTVYVNRSKTVQQGPCPVKYCGKPIEKGDYCGLHWSAVYRNGHVNRLKAENGTWQMDVNGYMRGTVNGERFYQHVYVAEQALGRKLVPPEEVHHLNEIKHDNRPENLVICPNRAYHLLLHERANALKRKKIRIEALGL